MERLSILFCAKEYNLQGIVNPYNIDNIFGGQNMNKAELVLEVVERADVSKNEAEAIINEFLALIEEELVKGNDVKISGFGVFSKKKRKERIGTSPSSHEMITIPANATVTFKPSKLLKEKVN